MRLDWKEFLIIAIFTLMIIFLNHNFSYTGYATAEPSVNIDLDKDSYVSNEKLQGKINITFFGNVPKDSEIYVELDDDHEEIKLTDYLDSINKTYSITPETNIVTNGEPVKNLSLTAGQQMAIGLSLPQLAKVNSIVMKIVGLPSNPTTSLTFDIPENSGKFEWKYLGSLQNYDATAIYPAGLNLQSEGSIQYIDSNLTYFCQQINMPYIKDFSVSAKYKPIAGTTSKLMAYIFSFDGTTAFGGADRCELPNTGTELSWRSCNINLNSAIQGYYLVCLSIDNQNQSYEIARDNAVATSKYNCELFDWGQYICTPGTSRNYLIYIKPGNYTQRLTGTIEASDFSKYLSDKDFSGSLTKYLESCQADEVGDCGVIINVKSDTNGYIELKDLRVDYTELGGGSSYSNKLYDISTTAAEIYKIANTTLDKSPLEIPLSQFNITTPNVTAKKSIDLFVQFAGDSDSEAIEVYSTSTPVEASELEEIIKDAKDKLNNIKTQPIGWLLSTESQILTLNDYQEQLNSIKNSNLSLDEKEGKIALLQDEVQTSINDMTDNVKKVLEYKDTVIVSSSDIENLFTENTNEIFDFQKKVIVSTSVAVYKVTNGGGSSEVYSLVKKTIQPKESINNVNVYEVIPKEVASSLSDITFQNPNFETVNDDPVIKYFYTTLNSISIVYAVKATITQPNVYKIKTIVMPKTVSPLPPPTPYECGDGKCSKPFEDEELCPEDCKQKSKIPWLWIIIALIVLVLGVIYINFYRGKLSPSKIAKKHSPFNTPQDFENVKKYINVQMEKKVRKSSISKALLEKGWTKEQVQYAFEDVEWEEKVHKQKTQVQQPKKQEETKIQPHSEFKEFKNYPFK